MGPGEPRVGRPSLQLDNQGRLPAEGARNGLGVEAGRESHLGLGVPRKSPSQASGPCSIVGAEAKAGAGPMPLPSLLFLSFTQFQHLAVHF